VAVCAHCGSANEVGRFCANCGAAAARKCDRSTADGPGGGSHGLGADGWGSEECCAAGRSHGHAAHGADCAHGIGAGLDYDVGSINADPSTGDPGRWGIYTAETAAAVGRFQANKGLTATNQVNPETWSALQSQSC
jgi:hypothetical protein